MVRRFVFTAFAAVSLLLAAESFCSAGDSAPTAGKAQPRMVISPVSWNFGKVREGKKIKHAFAVKNTGDADLTIESALENCECVSARLESPNIKPGKSVTLFVSVDTDGESGAFTGTVSVLSNDPVRPMCTIRISGEVVRK